MKNLQSDKVIYQFEYGMVPVIEIQPGDTIEVETNDCFFQQVQNEEKLFSDLDFDRINPATGPIYVQDADIGDLLKVEILDISIANKGVAGVLKDGGALGDLVKENITKIIPVNDQKVDYLGKKVPINPMIGVIGVSPGKNEKTWPTATPYMHGGNMDTTDIQTGATLYLPVREKGALLALGDVHGVMGDGELCFTGLEIPAKVTLRINLLKNKTTNWPLLENNEEIMVIGSGENLEKAIHNTAKEMVDIVKNVLRCTWEEAYIFNSLFVDYKISQVVNPMKTVRGVIKKSIISSKEFFNAL